MPKISEFFGIAIYIYYREHLPAHFHAIYQDGEVLIRIEDLSVLSGSLQGRALGLVMEWASLHRKELQHVWQQAVRHQMLDKIEPLR